MKFTKKEMAVIKALCESMRENGFDFGYLEDIKIEGMTARSISGTLRELHKKIDFEICDPIRTDSGRWTQITVNWTDEQFPDYDCSHGEFFASLPISRR